MSDPEFPASSSPNEQRDSEVVIAELAEPDSSEESPVISATLVARVRRRRAPIILFVLTCLSTFWVGSMHWLPFQQRDGMQVRGFVIDNWHFGLIYAGCVLAILLAHEFGHFIATLCHRVPASFPYFIPMPISPLGTLGAVIVMDGRTADRRQMFDIGLAGPLAGLAVAIPLLIYGVQDLDLTGRQSGVYAYQSPLFIQMLLQIQKPLGFENGNMIWNNQLNPFFMAGWTGLLVTGLNMMPVSQLDGGHVVYALFGKGARWIARGFMVLIIAFIVYDWEFMWIWVVMVGLVVLMGTDHPPTRNDQVPLGFFRRAIGFASLMIPVLCFPPRAMIMME
ncbi:MAG: site-2 protease family protein [Planctomycetes bacterium]|nr:site-2 protease family protein [Planctomycetota bacterium]